MFLGLLEMPELASSVKLFAALAPVFRLSSVRGLVANLTQYVELISGVLGVLGTGEFLGNSRQSRAISRIVCGNERLFKTTCKDIMFSICGGSGVQCIRL